MEIMHRTGNDHTREQQIKILIIRIYYYFNVASRRKDGWRKKSEGGDDAITQYTQVEQTFVLCCMSVDVF